MIFDKIKKILESECYVCGLTMLKCRCADKYSRIYRMALSLWTKGG